MSAESTSFIIDASRSMVQDGNVAKAMAYLEYALLEKVKRQRKTDWISCYLSNCHNTKNSQDIPGIYQVQSFVAPISTEQTLNILREVNSYSQDLVNDEVKKEIPDNELQCMIQCLLVASLDLKSQFNKRKLLRQIVIFTDDLNGLDLTPNEIVVLQEELNLRLILVDCCKETSSEDIFGSKWGLLIKAIPGSKVYRINELLIDITSLKFPIIKPVRVFSGELRLGSDPIGLIRNNFDPSADFKCLSIQVEGYPATKHVPSLNRKTVLKKEESGEVEYEPVKSIVEYETLVYDTDKRISISQESVAKAFRYGSDYVVLPSILDEKRFLNTLPGLDVRGFLDRKKMQNYYLTSESRFILADTKSGGIADVTMFNALVDAMLEYDKIAIARFVAKRQTEVQMCILCPLLVDSGVVVPNQVNGENFQRTFILSRLPFAEDERVSDFPRLINRTTTSGKAISQGKDSEQIDALMSQYVDSLDLDAQKYETVPDTKYYSMLNPIAKETSLPLPDDFEGESTNDPSRIPAIHIRRQQQVLLEYIHQKLINRSSEFQIPELPDMLRDIITPHFDSHSAKEQTELVKLLAIKKVEKESKRPDEVYESDDEDNIPSFEEIMAKGAR